MATYRNVFPSYDWDDVCYVNQIINMPNIVGRENIGFAKAVPNEEVKQSDAAVQRWIEQNMEGCSCLILFIGEKTYLSKWVLYEINLARERRMGRFCIELAGMKFAEKVAQLGPDPYEYHGLYDHTPGLKGYLIRKYRWVDYKGPEKIKDWIEDACQRAGR